LTLTFVLLTLVIAHQVPAMGYKCTEFGVDSFSHFPFRTWTVRQVELNALSNTGIAASM